MGYDGSGIAMRKRKIMGVFRVVLFCKNMLEQLAAKFLQKIIFCGKVIVKCGTADIGSIDDVLDRDLIIIFRIQKLFKSI